MREAATDTKPAGIAALAAFGNPPRAVDGLIEALLGTDVEPARWFVFDSDMEAMGALNEVWKWTIDIVLCTIPFIDTTIDIAVAAAALEILSSEDVPLDRCAWLHAMANPVERIDSVVGTVLPVDINAASHIEHVVLRLTHWQGAGYGGR
jgi:hypothetical protein